MELRGNRYAMRFSAYPGSWTGTVSHGTCEYSYDAVETHRWWDVEIEILWGERRTVGTMRINDGLARRHELALEEVLGIGDYIPKYVARPLDYYDLIAADLLRQAAIAEEGGQIIPGFKWPRLDEKKLRAWGIATEGRQLLIPTEEP